MKRFWDKVDIKGPNDCWEWKAGKASKYMAYGYFWDSDRRVMVRANRVSYRLTYGEFDPKWLVLHKCNNPGCVNPSHLYLGDKGDNAKDCKGDIGRLPRWYEGEIWLIRKLHSSGIKQRIIGQMFKVNQSTISDIVRDKNYPYKGCNRYVLTNNLDK